MNIVMVSSDGQCGVYETAQLILEGFRQEGHRARYIGVCRKDNRDLAHKLRQVADDDEVAIFEYEPGIFDLRGLVLQMARLRLRGKMVFLSVHEIEPAKYGEYHYILHQLGRPVRFRGLLELLWLVRVALGVAYRYFTLRVPLLLMGWLSHTVIVHSTKAEVHIGIVLADRRKVCYTPLPVKTLVGERDALREQLGLPRDVFAFVMPGFLFRRKRVIEVAGQLPPGTELWVVGLPSDYDPGYLEEIQAYLEHGDNREQVRLILNYEVEPYLLAADVVVLFYSEAYQSLVASLAIGAGKPCIFSDLPAFADLREAGLVVRTTGALRRAMGEIQRPEVYTELQAKAAQLGKRFSPSRVAACYVNSLMARNGSRPASAKRPRRG